MAVGSSAPAAAAAPSLEAVHNTGNYIPQDLPASVDVVAAVACSGYRCLDRDLCFRFDDGTTIASLAHSGISYISRSGQVQRISVDDAQELMQCNYTTNLLFQSSKMLRNYPFWGYTTSSSGGFEAYDQHHPSSITNGGVSEKVAIGHVTSLEDIERTALGLFATDAIDNGELIGEYTGVVLVETAALGVSSHDAYGICYQSVYEDGQLYLSALEYGNEIRCINHSFEPNARFTPMIHAGILHVFCFATRPIRAGEQIFVNYGPTYWKSAGISPLASF